MRLPIVFFAAVIGIFSVVPSFSGRHSEIRDKNSFAWSPGVSESNSGGAAIFFGPGRGDARPADSNGPKIDRYKELGLNSSVVISSIIQEIDERQTFDLFYKGPDPIPVREHSSFSKILFRVIISPNAP